MDQHDSDMDGSMSNNDEDLSDAELQDEDSNDALSRLPVEAVGDPEILAKLKQQEREEREEIERELKAHKELQRVESQRPRDTILSSSPQSMMGTDLTLRSPPTMVPPPLPFPHPAAPHPISTGPGPGSGAPPYPPNATAAAALNSISSASSHSSESSSSSQQTWSFEEQFKQVRQLYELSDDPKRKEFLDDLFSYMQKRGTPINRLPIMAKQVLDLYELYNLVIARGGLVDVINKKLWQEIIKGLHLPSSITSAAFTLRTQYMKYLYPYECEKNQLSTPAELQAAIDGNRREGRRSSYGTYAEMVQRNQSLAPGLPTHQMSPLSLVTSRPTMNGNGMNHHHPNPLTAGSPSCLATSEFEARMMEYVKLLNRELRSSASTPPISRQGSNSPPTSTSPRDSLSALEMSRFTLWNLYNTAAANEERHIPPQKEALNLEVSRQVAEQAKAFEAAREAAREAAAAAAIVKKEVQDSGPPPPKRFVSEEERMHAGVSGAHIKISSRGDSRTGIDNSLVVSMEINGIMYQGVLFAQAARNRLS